VLSLAYAASTPAAQPGTGATQAFEPFKHIGGVVPGVTRRSAVIAAFGEPEKTEITPKEKLAGKEFGGDTWLEYGSQGVSVLIVKENVGQADPVIDSIMVEAPYAGQSPNGLSIGMPWKNALAILKRDYHLDSDLDGSMNFAEKAGGKPDLQVWFAGDKLTRVKLFPR
jgi:hypothetical protein